MGNNLTSSSETKIYSIIWKEVVNTDLTNMQVSMVWHIVQPYWDHVISHCNHVTCYSNHVIIIESQIVTLSTHSTLTLTLGS